MNTGILQTYNENGDNLYPKILLDSIRDDEDSSVYGGVVIANGLAGKDVSNLNCVGVSNGGSTLFSVIGKDSSGNNSNKLLIGGTTKMEIGTVNNNLDVSCYDKFNFYNGVNAYGINSFGTTGINFYNENNTKIGQVHIAGTSLRIYGTNDIVVASKTSFSNDVSLDKKLYVDGDASLKTKLYVGSDASLMGKMYVAKDSSVIGKLYVGSDASISGKLSCYGFFSNGRGRLCGGGNLYINTKSSANSIANPPLVLGYDSSGGYNLILSWNEIQAAQHTDDSSLYLKSPLLIQHHGGDTKIGKSDSSIYLYGKTICGGDVSIKGNVVSNGIANTGSITTTGNVVSNGMINAGGTMSAKVNNVSGVYVGCPIGTVNLWASDSSYNYPDGWLPCCPGNGIEIPVMVGSSSDYDFKCDNIYYKVDPDASFNLPSKEATIYVSASVAKTLVKNIGYFYGIVKPSTYITHVKIPTLNFLSASIGNLMYIIKYK